MSNLDSSGKLSSINSRPLVSIDVAPSVVMTFANMTLGKPLKSMGLTTMFSATNSYDEFIEDEDHPNYVYDRVFHFWTMSHNDPTRLFGPYYVPYINDTQPDNGKTILKVRPLREVINPQFVKLSDKLYSVFFFSNFTTNLLPNNEYTDDPQYLMRTPEFATNYPEEIGVSSTTSPSDPDVGSDNILNYYSDENGVYVSNPRCALCSCIIRILPIKINENYDPPDPGGGVHRLYAMAEKPTIVNWVDNRFAHDFYPSLLVNRAQNLEWMADNSDATSQEEKSNEVPTKIVPPHHLINAVEGKMYPGYTGYDFETVPINNIFKDSLNYILEIERVGGDDPHGPEYCVYYDNFRPDAVEHRITKVEWSTVRAPQLTLTNRAWKYENSYEESRVIYYQYPYDGSLTDTWFVVLSIQYESILPDFSYDILRYSVCECEGPQPSSSGSEPSSSSGLIPAPSPKRPVSIKERFFADLTSDGYPSPYMGRSYSPIDSSVSYKFSFFNETIQYPLEPLEFSQGGGIYEYEEDLTSVQNKAYDRVLHFYMTSGGSGAYFEGPFYVPYISEVTVVGLKTKFILKPLREVINPRLQKLENDVWVMYFFTNFTETVDEYTDDPSLMKRMLEFATNFPSDVLSGTSPTPTETRRAPEDNTLNYYVEGEPAEIDTPRCALCSCIIRLSDFEIRIPPKGSSSSARVVKIKYPIAEKPKIVNWIGDRFTSDFVQPLLVNSTQRIEWSSNKQETDTLDEDATLFYPQRQMEYYNIINKIEAKMYPGYTGLNLGARPIVDIYGDSLYHVFVINVDGTDKYFLEVDPDSIFESPYNISSYSWEHSAIPTEMNEPGLIVEDDYTENTPSAKTKTHYIVMRLHASSSTASDATDYCNLL